MSDFPSVPENIYAYENEFSYSVWTPNTEIQLTNVTWDSAYRDIVRFDDDASRETFFSNQQQESIFLNGYVYLKFGEPIRLNIPFSQAQNFNYLIVKNQAQPVAGDTPTTFFYFVSNVQYIAPNTTQMNVQLDIWQTYCFNVKFGNCYINKGHIGIANENATLDNLSDYLTEPEGLNYGNEYEITNFAYQNFLSNDPIILVQSSASLTSEVGTTANPNLTTAEGMIVDTMPSACDIYGFNSENFLKFVEKLKDASWVSQCISMITVVPRDFITITPHRADLYILGDKTIDYDKIAEFDATKNKGVSYEMPINEDSDFFNFFAIPSRFKNLKKFYTSPYSELELTNYSGGSIALKPECMNVNKNDSGAYKTTLKLMNNANFPNFRGYVYPVLYNARKGTSAEFKVEYKAVNGETYEAFIQGGEFLDLAIQFCNFPQLSILNNQYINYLASNANSLNYQFASADWSQQKAQTSAQLSYDQSANAISTSQQQTSLSNQLAWQNWGVNTAGSVAKSAFSAIGSAMNGQIGSAVSGLANTAIDAGVSYANTTNQTAYNTASNDLSNANAQYNADTNLAYAQFASKGDYETAIQGIQAKCEDAKLLQPTVSGQNCGDAFNFSRGLYGFHLKWKRIKNNFINQIGDFWLRYGYYVNRWITPPADLKCCENFTYWKMQATYLTGAIPEDFKQTIRGIFEKGVTVWSDPTKIGQIDLADNEPLKGIEY